MPDLFSAADSIGYPEIEDLQNFDDNNGFAVWLRTVSPEGRRQDTAHTFVHPLLQDGKHPNLHVLVEHQVVRVLFDDGKRACGVEFQANPVFHPGEEASRAVRARKMVVISAGALGSPPILERSGVGNPLYLEKVGVEVLVDLPGVGHDYQDHNLTMAGYETSLPPEKTTNIFWTGKVNTDEAVNNKHEMLGWNGTDVCAKVRPSAADVASLGPEFQAAWEQDFASDPNRPMMFIGLLAGYVLPLFCCVHG